VVAVRLVTSKDSGKPKGYGFVEFPDGVTAEAAVRHLNGRELAGRALRVDFAEHPDGSRVVVGSRRGALRCAAALLCVMRVCCALLRVLCVRGCTCGVCADARAPRPRVESTRAVRGAVRSPRR
jgi:RNA recognition motif-containing protein